MNYPIALILAIAAGREDDLLTQLASVLSIEDPPGSDPRVLRVDLDGHTGRWAYRRVVAASGQDALAIPSRPSSGTGQLWHLWIVQPYDEMPVSWTKTFRDRLAAWAAARQPTAGGLWHLLGPVTPEKAKLLLSPAAWAACVAAWWTYWRAESSPEGLLAQQNTVDADLES